MFDFFWESQGWEEEDKHLRELAAMPFRRPMPFIPQEPGLYILRGPRQVGKSSWLKTVLAHHVATKTCFYLSCELVRDYRELAELLASVSRRDVILLDEVSFVDGWDRAVKHFIDSGTRAIIMVTGSHAFDLKRGADQMPGRFGASGGEVCLLPMDFEEFSAARTQAGWSLGDPLEELRCFFRIGGFPRAVAESGPLGKTPVKALDTYWRWLLGDVIKLGKQENYLREVLFQLAQTLCTPVSFQTFAKKTSIGSHNTVQEYLSLLESCFAVRTLFAIDPSSGVYKFRKNKKFYFTDPLLYRLGCSLGGVSSASDYEAKVAELVAHEALARRYARFGYCGSQAGEIDFLMPKKWALEVKWSPAASHLSKAYLDVVVPWKRVWTYENFLRAFPPSF